MTTTHTPSAPSGASGFAALGLPPVLLQALAAVGYETPSPIQAATVPPLLQGRDVLGQAQTGTGKTAAFALPILARVDVTLAQPQALVLAPTRELAIQVAEAFARYAATLPGFHVLPIYGGQSYGPQLHALRRGAHVVVGTPGRVLDHLQRGTLSLSALRTLVLDEADEMLRMGFIEDVERILEATPPTRQIALFSATVPTPIKRIAERHLRDAQHIRIQTRTSTAPQVRQRYWLVGGLHKLDALTRLLEVETFTGMIVFARTRQATEELAGKLAARGFDAAALHGDVAQAQRERIVQRFRDGQGEILVATDVAARGLDLERISHVVNYDIPTDTESYIHRIGRTGRAGRSGEAILFVTPRERHLLRAIERATRQPIEPMHMPDARTVNDRRIERFMQRISDARALDDLAPYLQLIERYETSHDAPAREIAAALARLLQGDTPLLLDERERATPAHTSKPQSDKPHTGKPRPDPSRPHGAKRTAHADADTPDATLVPWRVAVGRRHGIQARNLVGAIANEGGLPIAHIGRIELRGEHSVVELPADLPAETLHALRKARVGGQMLKIERYSGKLEERPHKPRRKPAHD